MFQHMDGSSTAWALPSVTALTHLAIVCEALLIESEKISRKCHFDMPTSTEAHSKTFLLRIFRNNKQQRTIKVYAATCKYCKNQLIN